MGHFSFREGAEFAGRNVERNRTKSNAFDFFDVVTDVVEHPPDLPVPTLNENHFEPRIGRILKKADFGRGRLDTAAVVKRYGDAATKPLQRLFRWPAADFDVIGLRHVRSSFSQLLRECAIICEQKKPFARVVEAANRIQTLRLISEKFHYSGSTFGISRGCNVTFGLVQQKINEARPSADRAAINTNRIVRRISFGAKFGDNRTINANVACADEFLGFPARCHAGCGKNFL